jgi:hypothetical protein
MNRSAFVALGLAGALALLAAPASAQHHRNGGERHDTAAPRTESPQGERPREQAQARPQAQSQSQSQSRQRDESRAVPRDEHRENRQEHAAPRQERRPEYSAPRYVAPRYDAPRYYRGRYYGPRYVGPRFSVAPRRFYRPYYVFRPRFSIGFGIWAGYPVTYYDPYYYPYDYYPYASSAPGYPPPPQASVGVQPGQVNMGGLSFDITPDTAEVYVDGNYFGEVGQFTAATQPLGLPAGRHHVELREPGFEVTSFDVDIIGGQVIPYQGQLRR